MRFPLALLWLELYENDQEYAGSRTALWSALYQVNRSRARWKIPSIDG